MSDYSSFTIDGTDVIFDPDSISVTTGNLIGVNRSMGGTSYITAISSNSPSYNRTVSISGIYLPATAAAALLASSIKKSAVQVTGGGSGSGSLLALGTGSYFIITSLNTSPTKPRIDYPVSGTANTEVKYAYTISLQEVDAE